MSEENNPNPEEHKSAQEILDETGNPTQPVKKEEPAQQATQEEVKEKVVEALGGETKKEEKPPEKKEEKKEAHHTHHGHHHKPKKKVKLNLNLINILLMVVIGVLLIHNMAAIVNMNVDDSELVLDGDSDLTAPTTKKAELDVIVLTAKCDECQDTGETLNILKTFNVEVSEEEIEYDSTEGKKLVEEYNVTGVPTLIIKGDINEVTELQFLQQTNDAIVLPATPPFMDPKTGEIQGKITITYFVKPDCTDCFNITQLTGQLQTFGVVIAKEKIIDVTTNEGQEALEDYEITKVPTFLVSSDIKAYNQLYTAWKELSIEQDDGSLLITQVTPPYYDYETEKVEGYVTLTKIVDETCTGCYDAGIHEQILVNNFGVALNEINTVDINSQEGKELIEKYEITKVPTILLSKELSAYPAVAEMWTELGSIEEDGSYLFREFDQLGEPYMDLEKGQLVNEGMGITGPAVAAGNMPLDEDAVIEEAIANMDSEEAAKIAENTPPTEDAVVEDTEDETNEPPVLDLGLE